MSERSKKKKELVFSLDKICLAIKEDSKPYKDEKTLGDFKEKLKPILFNGVLSNNKLPFRANLLKIC